jgi:hypothetical protein
VIASAASDTSRATSPSTKQKRRNDFSPATKFCVVATDTAADSRSTAEVTSAAVTEPSPPAGSRPAKNRRACSTYPRTVPAVRPRSTSR